MKVLIFTTQFWQLGGAERLSVQLAEDLNARGIHADILSMYAEDLPGVPQATERLIQRGVPAVRFLGLEVQPPAASALKAIVSLRRLLRRQRYDIVETSLMAPRVIALAATLGLRTRHVAGVHEVFSLERSDESRFPLWRFFLRLNTRTRFYAISEYAKRAWAEYCGAPLEHIRTVYNGISPEWFEAKGDRGALRAELQVPDDARLILFVGRVLERKGVKTILDAVGPILETSNLYILYVGGSDEPPHPHFPAERGFMNNLKAQITREGYANRVRFLGLRKDVPRLMASSDLLLHAPRYEGFGLVLVEAMAAGLPLVASNVEGIPEVLSGTNYPMVPPDDVVALRQAVVTSLGRSPEEAAEAVALGRRRASALRSERRVAEMIRLFEDVVADAF